MAVRVYGIGIYRIYSCRYSCTQVMYNKKSVSLYMINLNKKARGNINRILLYKRKKSLILYSSSSVMNEGILDRARKSESE